MFSLKKKTALCFLGLLMALPLVITTAKADDMEIYNMTTDAQAAGDVNIIFLLDNSGSMKYCIDRSGTTNDTWHSNMHCKNDLNSRAFALRKAMTGVLDKLADTTKVSVFTYGRKTGTSNAGTMLAPLRALNEKLPNSSKTHKEYLLDWFIDSTKTGDDRFKTLNEPPNFAYNFGPTNSSYTTSDPPTCANNSSATACQRNWNDKESSLYTNNSTPLESAYAEIGAYLMGQQASTWGNTYFARTGNLAKISTITVSSGWNSYTYASKLDSTLDVTSITPLVYSDGEYRYRQPDYTVQQTCAAPSWHVILVTDGEPNNDNNMNMFKTVMGDQSNCSTNTTWSCSKELASFLANSTISFPQYSWNCTTNCGAYTDISGNSATPSAPTSMNSCKKASDRNNTTTTKIKNYTASYDWICEKKGTKYNWRCTGSNGGACTDQNSNAPSNSSCSSSNVNQTRTSYGKAKDVTVYWQCAVETASKSYTNGLGIDIKTDAIFVGPDASDTAIKEMTDITNNGNGVFNKPTSVDELIDALLSTVAVAEKEPNTISAPGVAVNQLSRFQHLDQLYYSVFQPDATSLWEGNLKRFVLEDSTIKDSQKQEAVDPDTKFFKISADTCWGIAGSSQKQPAGCLGYTVNDGKDSTLGGMRSKLDVDSRKVLTSTDGSNVVTLESLRLDAGSTSTNTATTAGYLGYSADCASSTAQHCNGALTALGADNAAQISAFNNLIDWGKGVRAAGSAKMLAGDPLHSQPVLVNYGFTGEDLSGAERQEAFDAALADGSLQENYVFLSTNGGALHAVDANTGVEKFAFIPKEMLPLIPKTKNVSTWTGAASRVYGLDSTWMSWRRDANNDGTISGQDDWVYLYGGMRMGGSNYYALDVTNITSPAIKWTINGPLSGGFNTINDSGTTVYRPITMPSLPNNAYRWMGQTWSKPVLARIALKDGSDEVGRTVLVFGGGYDPTNETQPYINASGNLVTPPSTFGTDAYGHQLYIVDAKTGDLLFWAAGGSGTYGNDTTTDVTESPTLSVTDMKYSITGSPVPVDRDGDGYTDLIYFADLGGQVFRMDLKNSNTNNGVTTTCASSITSTCSDLVMRVARIGSFGEAADSDNIAHQRRFFEAPGIGIMQRQDGTQYMGVAIGSGNRSHPAYVGTQDRIYVFEDEAALTPDLSSLNAQLTLTHSELEDVTSYDYDEDNLAVFTGKSGFYFDVSKASGTGADGEKVFSTPLIFQGLVYVTSYIPETGVPAAQNQCSPGTGSSSLYVFNVFDGRSAKTDHNDLLDRAIEGITSTITGDVQIVFNADGTSTILAGTFALDAGEGNKGLRRTRWYENPRY